MKAGAASGPAIGGVNPPAGATASLKASDAARGLEAFFLRELLKEARPASGGLMGQGAGGATFQDMLEETLSDQMAKAGGVGIAQLVAKELGGQAPGPAALLPRASALAPVGRFAPGAAPHLHKEAVRAYQSSGFGARLDPITGAESTHAGVDVAAPEGASVRAAFGGTVVRAEPAGGYGNLVVIDHGDGTETRYAHLSKIRAQVGQRVRAGDDLGAVGHTGRATGAHLHIELRQSGVAIDPHSLIDPLKLVR
jgi:murein DD-endopeptidase MepM/ murein hydrolase activator NlpD